MSTNPRLPQQVPYQMPPNFPVDKSYLIASWCAASLWGAFTVIFVFCLISVFSRPDRPRNLISLGMVIAMYILATGHVSLMLARNIEAFIVHVHDVGPILYLADVTQPLNRSKYMIYSTLIVLGDSVLLWRCFMVWNRNYIAVALPAIMIIGTAISGYGAVSRYFLANPDQIIATKWAEGMLVVSMVTNILLTILTAGRLWMLSRKFKDMSFGSSQSRYNYVILLILESGVIMTVCKTMEFILFELAPTNRLDGLKAIYIVMDCMPQIMGICPTLIIMAVNRGFTTANSEAYTHSGYAQGRDRHHIHNRPSQTSVPIILASPKKNETSRTLFSVSNQSHTGKEESYV